MSRSYPSKYHRIIANVEETHFWFRARRELITSLLRRYSSSPSKKRFCEIGFGTGELLSEIEHLGFQTTGIDSNAKALQYAKEKTHATLIRTSLAGFHPEEKFDAIGLFDVLEHQKEDKKFLHQCANILRPNGLFFLTVPAGPWLWSDMDRLSGHVRRYTKGELLEKLKTNGFHPLWCNYWNVLLLPFYAVWKFISVFVGKSNPAQFVSAMNPVLNNIFFYIITIENNVTVHIPFLFGTSLVVVARKERLLK